MVAGLWEDALFAGETELVDELGTDVTEFVVELDVDNAVAVDAAADDDDNDDDPGDDD